MSPAASGAESAQTPEDVAVLGEGPLQMSLVRLSHTGPGGPPGDRCPWRGGDSRWPGRHRRGDRDRPEDAATSQGDEEARQSSPRVRQEPRLGFSLQEPLASGTVQDTFPLFLGAVLGQSLVAAAEN